MTQPDPAELGRRVRAARCYPKPTLSAEALAKAIPTSKSSVNRFEAGKGMDDVKLEGFLRRAAEVCGLPVGFFYADFSRLGEIALSTQPGGPGGVPEQLPPAEGPPRDAQDEDEPPTGTEG